MHIVIYITVTPCSHHKTGVILKRTSSYLWKYCFHLDRSSYSPPRRSSRRLHVVGSASDSSDFSQSSRARRRVKSFPHHPLHISSSSGTSDSRQSSHVKESASKVLDSNRKRSKDLSDNLGKPSAPSDGSSSDSAITRATRSKSVKQVTTTATSSRPATRNTSWSSAHQSQNTSDDSPTGLKVHHKRSSRGGQTPEATRRSSRCRSPNSNYQSSHETGSARRSSRNRNNK